MPSVVHSCSSLTSSILTGALNFGDEAEIKKLANERLASVKKKFGKGEILDREDVRALFLVVDEYAKYVPIAI